MCKDKQERSNWLGVAMASSLFSTHSFLFQFPSKPSILPKTPSSSSAFPNLSTCSSPKSVSSLKLRLPRASSEELPTELIEDSKFVPLESEDPSYGPPIYRPLSKPNKSGEALLLLGFKVEEAVKIQQLLKEMDGEFLEVIFCTEDMISRSLWEAINTKQPKLEDVKIAKSLPRICFLSGLTGEEMMVFIDSFPESGLEPPAFAALVPNSADKPVAELIEEIMLDHEMLCKKNGLEGMQRYSQKFKIGGQPKPMEIFINGRNKFPSEF